MVRELFWPRTLVRGFCSACLVVVAPAVMATGFQIAPTIAEVATGTRVASFELRNPGDAAVTVQVDALDWTQSVGSSDQLKPARDVVVVPRIATLSPHASQLVRVALQGENEHERAYRLRLREVPPPPPPGFMGVRTLVEQLVPVFFQTNATDAVEWHARLQPTGSVLLVAHNAGGRHLPLSGIRLVDERGAILAERKGPGYVLAGQSTQWPLETHAHLSHGDTLRLEFLTHGSTQAIALHVE